MKDRKVSEERKVSRGKKRERKREVSEGMGNVSPHFLTKESELYYILCSHWGKENKESNHVSESLREEGK